MKAGKIIILTTIIIALFSSMVHAIKVDPTSITEELISGQTKYVEVTIKNDANETRHYNLVSSNPDVISLSKTSLTLSPNSNQKINVTLVGSNKDVYGSIIISGDEFFVIPVTIKATTNGDLEPIYNKMVIPVEPGVIIDRIVSFRNKYNVEIEIKDAYVMNAIVVPGGKTKPVYIKSAQFGKLQPGNDFTITIEINTVDLPYPKTYTPRLVVVYYVGDERKESYIDFVINVDRQLTTTYKTMRLVIVPEEPVPGDRVNALLLGENNETVAGDIFVKVFDLDGNKLSEFKMIGPFIVEANKKYCLVGKADYYETVEKCFVPKIKNLRISIPSKINVNETVIVKVVDNEGNIIPTAKLKIDNKEFDSPQVTVKFDAGTHIIYAEAPGYEPVSRTVSVVAPVEFVNFTNSTYKVGESIVINLNRDAQYYIYYQGNQVGSGYGSVIEFTPQQEGNYTVCAEDKCMDVFVEGRLFSIPEISITKKHIAVVAVLLILLLLIKGRGKKRARRITWQSSPLRELEE